MPIESLTPKITLISDPTVLAIPIYENNDPIVDLTNQTVIAFGPSPEVPHNTAYTKVRQTVYEMLVKAQSLLPNNLKFCLYEGYRSLALQERLFNEHLQHIQTRHPHWQPDEVFTETTKLVSPLVNLDGTENIPPHSTGGAIDLYLIDAKGSPIDMGIHPQDWMSDLDDILSPTLAQSISRSAQKNRTIMSEVLLEVGFANYPTEYWHWSYGDRYWAYMTNHRHALYGTIK